jgi:hypothetical protein
LTGARLGLILQATGTTITALIIAFIAGWKLTLVILCITPLIILSGKVQSLQHTSDNRTNLNKKSTKLSFIEQGSQVMSRIIRSFLSELDSIYSTLVKLWNTFERLLLCIVKNIFYLGINKHSMANSSKNSVKILNFHFNVS